MDIDNSDEEMIEQDGDPWQLDEMILTTTVIEVKNRMNRLSSGMNYMYYYHGLRIILTYYI